MTIREIAQGHLKNVRLQFDSESEFKYKRES